MTSTLNIIIVNWNSGPQLRACLESVTAATLRGFALGRVVVVDNASEDGSAGGLEDLDLPLTVLRNERNAGFAAACNQGATASGNADYLLFLNPDTLLLPDSLSEPMSFMERPEGTGYGICGCRMTGEDGNTVCSCSRFPTLGTFFVMIFGLNRLLPRVFKGIQHTEWDHDSDRDVDQVIGAFYLVRATLFQELGGFDERFFVYFEDLDFALRARRAGRPSRYCATASVAHKGGGTSEQVPAARLAYLLHSRILFSQKHFSRLAAAAVRFGTLYIEPFARLVFALLRADTREAANTRAAFRLLRGRLKSGRQHVTTQDENQVEVKVKVEEKQNPIK